MLTSTNEHITAAGEGVRAVLGYDRLPGVSKAQYDDWLMNVHYPDLLANPHLDAIVLHDVLRPVRDGQTFERIAELHFSSMEAYEAFNAWRDAHPVADQREPIHFSDFRFYVLCQSTSYRATRSTDAHE